MLTTGWNWVQRTGSDFYQVKFQPYFNTQIFIDSQLEVVRLLNQAFTFDI